MSELKAFNMPRYAGQFTMHEVYLKSEADKVIADKDKKIAKLKSDIADLRDDKKSTDAILDERNAENAELKDKLQAANEQIENLINSASSIMLTQDRVNDNECAELRHQKYKRCLAMAEACIHKRWRLDEEGFDYARSTRQMNKCLELAEKFKEVK